MYRISLEVKLPDATEKYGKWVGVTLKSGGDNLDELIVGAIVTGTDQDGGEVFIDELVDSEYCQKGIEILERLTGEKSDLSY